jgi:hypothetical protein
VLLERSRDALTQLFHGEFAAVVQRHSLGRVFVNTIEISLLRLLVGFPAPIILALMLNELRAGGFKRTVQTIRERHIRRASYGRWGLGQKATPWAAVLGPPAL